MPKSHTGPQPRTAVISTARSASSSPVLSLCSEFAKLINVDWTPPERLRTIATAFLRGVGASHLRTRAARAKSIAPIIAQKLKLNRYALQSLWDTAAARGHFFSPATKSMVAEMFNARKRTAFCRWLTDSHLPTALGDLFCPVEPAQAIEALHGQLENARINRSDARSGVQPERREALLRALFGSWLYAGVDARRAQGFFCGLDEKELPNRYIDLLRRRHPAIVARSCGAVAIRVPRDWFSSYTLHSIREYVIQSISSSYDKLSNHSYCGIIFEFPDDTGLHGGVWELIGNATLFAERLRAQRLENRFYRPEKIAEDTRRYIRSLDMKKAEFGSFSSDFCSRTTSWHVGSR